MDRLEKQMEFLLKLDQMKEVVRQTYLADGSCKENDAEHSWHMAVMTAVLVALSIVSPLPPLASTSRKTGMSRE